MIDILLNYDINLFAILLLSTMFVITLIKRDIYRFSTNLLRLIIGLNIALLIIEPISWIFDHNPYTSLFINYAANYLIVLLTPVIIGLWQSYMDYKIFRDKSRLVRRHYYQFASYLIFLLLSVNFFVPIFFSIDSSAHYHEASLVWIRYVITYSAFVYVLIFTLIYRKKFISNVITGIVMFFFIPALGAFAQIFYPNFFFSWTMLALSVVLVYIFLETTSGSKDYLTDLYSRQTLEDYLIAITNENIPFEIALIDIDRFKEVNDSFGHMMGDQVLICFSKVMQNVFYKKAFIARLGGDEFIIVYFSEGEKIKLEKYLVLLEATLKTDATWSQFDFLSFSYGTARFDHGQTMDDLIKEADHMMYQNKENKPKTQIIID